jgi:hypothetical protein
VQEAILVQPGREPLLSPPLLRSLSQLNRRFLGLACSGASLGEWGLQVPADLGVRIASLSDARRDALSRCPYALFDIRFCDDRHWEDAVQWAFRWKVEDAADMDLRTGEFLQLALFYVWHLAQTQPLSAPLILGMSERVALELAKVTLDRLPGLLMAQRHHLGLRWPHCRSYWHSVTSAPPDSPAFRKAQLFGFQIAAAVRLSLS